MDKRKKQMDEWMKKVDVSIEEQTSESLSYMDRSTDG